MTLVPYPVSNCRTSNLCLELGSDNRATEEQKRKVWEMAVRIENILCTVLNEAGGGDD